MKPASIVSSCKFRGAARQRNSSSLKSTSAAIINLSHLFIFTNLISVKYPLTKISLNGYSTLTRAAKETIFRPFSPARILRIFKTKLVHDFI